MKINILGVLVDKITMKQVLDKIKNWLGSEKQHYIVTPNPEFIVAAQKDEKFKNILNQADIAIPDGIGLIFASWFLLKPLKRVHGSDLTYQILKLAEEKNYKIYFFSWSKGLSTADEIKKLIKEKYKIEIEGQGIERDKQNIDWQKIQNL